MSNFNTLANLGWQPYFQQQLSLEEWDSTIPARVIEQHKSNIEIASEENELTIQIQASFPQLVVGDWILLDEDLKFIRTLDRKTCFTRKAAGTKVTTQLISANVDTAFIVCSMNEDFNLNRIERFLSVVNESGAVPVVILSKSDLCENSDYFIKQIQKLDSMLCIESVNCLDSNDVSRLKPWLKPGSTVALIGSSGVGKSSLINTIIGGSQQQTGNIRVNDKKGRHTTSRRSLLATPEGLMILDTPGMREIQLADCRDGLSITFSDIELLAKKCRFNNCQHQSEPGCAVLNAVSSNELDSRRLANYLKLLREEALNTSSLAQRRANEKALSRFYKKTQSLMSEFKRRE